jgi:hypothetical protein
MIYRAIVKHGNIIFYRSMTANKESSAESAFRIKFRQAYPNVKTFKAKVWRA